MGVRTIGVGLLVGCVLAALGPPARAQDRSLGLRPPTPEEAAQIAAHVQPVTSLAPNALSIARAQDEARRLGRVQVAALPSAVDNSTLPAFPPIRNQSPQSSCTAFSVGYYYSTFTQAADEGKNAAAGGLDDLCSPAFLYNLTNYGVDAGSNVQYAMLKLSQVGCSSWADMPWTPVTDSYAFEWPSEAAWVNALRNRTEATHTFDGSTAPGTDTLKQHLANGNLAVFGTEVHKTWYDDYTLADDTGLSNGVLYALDGPVIGGHAMTFVGYDDARSYVDHRDELTHYGAFLVANSWGPTWGTTNTVGRKGFMWVAYPLLQDLGFWYGDDRNVCFNDDRPDYRPTLYAVTGVNHAQRGRVRLSGSVSGASTWYSHYALSYDYGGTTLPIDDTRRVAVDLTDGVSALHAVGPSTLSVRLGVSSQATTNGTLTSADFYEDVDADGTYQHVASTMPPVTVTPGATGTASASVTSASGADYELVSQVLPQALTWGESFPSTVRVRNLGSTAWTTTDGYALQRSGEVNRWSFTATPLGAFVNPLATYDYTFTLKAPPVTTLAYAAPVSGTVPAGPGTLPVELVMTHHNVPMTGEPIHADVVLSRFPDVQPDGDAGWARTPVEQCAGRIPRIVSGYPDGSYRPEVIVTRDQMAVYIRRSLNLPLAAYAGRFPDIASDSFGAQEIEALATAGIVGGYPDGWYHPDVPVTRDAMAVFIARGMAGSDEAVPAGPAEPTFPDVLSTGDEAWAYKYVEYCSAQGVVGGYPDGTYQPLLPVDRGQMAVFVYRAFIQARPSAVVLAGPALTLEDTVTAGLCGWASKSSVPASSPGNAYVTFDAVRLNDTLAAVDDRWQVQFELRDANTPNLPAAGLYTWTANLTPGEIDAARTTALATGVPYWTITWALPPTGLVTKSYQLVISVETVPGTVSELPQRWGVTLTP